MAEVKGEALLILAINPGANSTKLGLFQGMQPLVVAKLEHTDEDLAIYERVEEQLPYRKKLVVDWLEQQSYNIKDIAAIVARGGLLQPVAGGTYIVNQTMVDHLHQAKNGSHASNLAGLIAAELAWENSLPAYIVDPVVVDELEPVARISGLKGVERTSKSHALNSKAVARTVAAQLGKTYDGVRLITVHLGSGISVAAHVGGRMIDVSNAVSGGPFSVERCGSLPVEELVNLCYSNTYNREEMMRKIYREGGIYSYLGTRDLRQAESRANQGDQEAELILASLAYQTAKEIGAMATVLQGKLDRIILTGSMCHSRQLVDRITQRIKWIGPVVQLPGEQELEALVAGGLRVLTKQEEGKIYDF